MLFRSFQILEYECLCVCACVIVYVNGKPYQTWNIRNQTNENENLFYLLLFVEQQEFHTKERKENENACQQMPLNYI